VLTVTDLAQDAVIGIAEDGDVGRPRLRVADGAFVGSLVVWSAR
jgi:hypothetical protein